MLDGVEIRLWTVLLQGGDGGWVMGVFTSRDDALAKLRVYEATEGGSELGEPTYGVGGDAAMCEIPITNSETSRCFIIAGHILGKLDP